MINDHEAAISVNDLVKQFGEFTAVKGINFEVQAGEIFGLLGPNGSGKTTTIRMMLGLLPPSEGTIRVLGLDVAKNPQKLRWRVGYMAQRFSLYNDLTVEQNLRFYGQAYGLTGENLRQRMVEVLIQAGLQGREHMLTKHLSGGWRQRLALSAAIMHKPEVIFLDEPTAGVDPVSRREFWELLYRLTEQGVTIFVTTHYMDEAEHCHRLGFLQRGSLIALGSPSSIKHEMMQGTVIELDVLDNAAAIDLMRQASQQGQFPMRQVELYGDLIHIVLDRETGAVELTRQLLREHRLEVENVRQIEPSLEDVFISCMR